MRRLFFAYAMTVIGLFVIDFGWLITMTPAFYKPRIGALLLETPNLTAAVLFYLLYCAGVVALAIWPAMQSGDWTDALWRGAILGLVAYGTYDLTYMATLKGWSWELTVVDMVWGTLLTGATATVASIAGTWFQSR